MCTGVLIASLYVHHINVWHPQRPEQDIISPGAGITVSSHVGAGTQFLILRENRQCSQLQSYPSSYSLSRKWLEEFTDQDMAYLVDVSSAFEMRILVIMCRILGMCTENI